MTLICHQPPLAPAMYLNRGILGRISAIITTQNVDCRRLTIHMSNIVHVHLIFFANISDPPYMFKMYRTALAYPQVAQSSHFIYPTCPEISDHRSRTFRLLYS